LPLVRSLPSAFAAAPRWSLAYCPSTSVSVLRRQRPGRLQLSSLDRLLWLLLYRIWPQVIGAMVLVKPATAVEWHRRGFRLYWRWRSRAPGRPRISPDIRDLIRRMSKANPLWGAPRIHGELLKLAINVSQATVGRWMPWRPKVPSPTWRSFLRNHLPDIAAIDMFRGHGDVPPALRLDRAKS
jgi:putative transposase